MIINTVQEYGKAVDDGVEMECEFWEPPMDGSVNRWWREEVADRQVSVLQGVIKEGRIRTKPKAVDIKISLNVAGLVVDTDGLYCLPDDRRVAKTITKRITLED